MGCIWWLRCVIMVIMPSSASCNDGAFYMENGQKIIYVKDKELKVAFQARSFSGKCSCMVSILGKKLNNRRSVSFLSCVYFIEDTFLHAMLWIPAGEKSILTVVILWQRSPLHRFVHARTINEYDVTMPVPHICVMLQINCDDITMLSLKRLSLVSKFCLIFVFKQVS